MSIFCTGLMAVLMQKKGSQVSRTSPFPSAFLTVAEKLFPENMDKIGRVKSLNKPVTLPIPRHSSSDRSPSARV
jgi:hypothetical protein